MALPEMRYVDALRRAIELEMEADARVMVLGEDVAVGGPFGVTAGLVEKFGERRVMNTPISEDSIMGLATGAALAGRRPVVEIMFVDFATLAMSQLVNHTAKLRYMSGGQLAVPLVVRMQQGAGGGWGAHHSQCLEAWFHHVPGLKVVAPSTPADAKGLLRAAIRDPNPVLVLENEILYGIAGPVPKVADWLVPIGKARIARPGRHVTVVSFSRGMQYALAAAETLAKEGIEAEVIDLRSLRPIDWETIITSIKRTNRLVTVEEAWPVCSIGSEICAQAAIQAFDYLDAPPAKVSGADVPMPYAANLEKLALPTAEQVVQAVKSVCYA